MAVQLSVDKRSTLNSRGELRPAQNVWGGKGE